MAMRELRYFGDPVLKTVCDPVTRFDKGLRQLVTDLLDSVKPGGRAGLAAPQIGVSLRVFSYDVGGLTGYVINPELAEVSEETHEIEEGCLSVPELRFPVTRAVRAVVRGVDVDNEPVVVEGKDVLAQCLQHETDHLNGMLYLDRLAKDTKREALRQARNTDWFWRR
ncbi:peptide deformylase [Amycolatopsis bartoniae]|uniref:Peptide deformylase n=1 Tax=Amycolatopsis bartoniae TaxID=941986 RepID=A0A8H9MFE9_9PSEU|nr:peptide deformylase [Amycolatopsis bartoniae]MBB2933975.1 peptide deformylase [Amycolatopsis bartoniae]TVT02829.1 peptide deformylase [Amycolatopsis bartoniae]GHF86204.1 peptide deformylase [Amycolatopsis bartoniae]